jgi:HEAT repeat protein
VEALRKISEPAVEPLIRALNDKRSDVRESAADALRKMGKYDG